MKKITLLFAFAGLAFAGKAQTYSAVTLTDTFYHQDFSTLATALPTGWHVFTGAKVDSLGVTRDTSATKLVLTPTNWANITGNFRNVASTTLGQIDSAAQAAATNRALGVRQVSYNNGTFGATDSGASMCIKLANTEHLGGFKLSFRLQSADTSSPRTTTWTVDYGMGALPTSFTAATAVGTLTTGNHVFSDNVVTVNFGTALDSLSGPVWIRIAALQASTGSGNRATTAIDDFHLSYTASTAPTSVANMRNVNMPLSVLGNASANQMSVGFTTAEAGKFNLAVLDLTGRVLYSESINAVAGTQRYTVNGMNLASGLYIVKLSNGSQSGVTKAMVN